MEHAIEHLTKKTGKDAKLAVLHADNSVELILKEIIRFKGVRLIDRKGHSIGYYDCIDKLLSKGVSIPELPDIDLLHTERNSIYHLGTQPDQEKSEWLVYDVALGFLRRICKEELSYDITTFSDSFDLSPEIEQEIALTRSEIGNKYLLDTVSAINSNMYEAAVLLAYSGIEAIFRESISKDIRSHYNMLKIMKDKKIISELLFQEFQVVRHIRNRIAHGVSKATKNEARIALELLKRVIDEIGLQTS